MIVICLSSISLAAEDPVNQDSKRNLVLNYLDYALAGFVGAFALGVYSNVFSRLMNLPSSIVMLLGLVVLVPGSKVYIGLSSLVSGQMMLNTPGVGIQTFLIFHPEINPISDLFISFCLVSHRFNYILDENTLKKYDFTAEQVPALFIPKEYEMYFDNEE